MTTQPLTPQNPTVIIAARSQADVDFVLTRYGIPTDAGNVAPTLTVVPITSMAGLIAYLATVPSPTLPWTMLVGFPPEVGAALYSNMQSYFGQAQTLSSCMAMLNNEYAIAPGRLV